MSDQVYLIPGVGLVSDSEQGKVILIPGGGLYKEQVGGGGGVTESVAGTLPAMLGLLSRKVSYHRSLEGTI